MRVVSLDTPGTRVFVLREKTMKTYLYRCEECGEEKEHPAKAEAPVCCEGKAMVKVYTPTAVIYKGKGFYSTGE